MGAEAFSTLQSTSDTYNRYDFQKKDRERRKGKVIHFLAQKAPFYLSWNLPSCCCYTENTLKSFSIAFPKLRKTFSEARASTHRYTCVFFCWLFFYFISFYLKLKTASEKCCSWHSSHTARDPQNNHSSVSIAMTKQWMLQKFYETKMWSSIAINSVLLSLLKTFSFLCKWSVFSTHMCPSIFLFCHLLQSYFI